jgi:hypothetical protein
VIEHELDDADSGDKVHGELYVPLVPPSLHVTVPVGVVGVPLVSVTVAVAVVVPPITTAGVLMVTAVAVVAANAGCAADITSRNTGVMTLPTPLFRAAYANMSSSGMESSVT